MTMAGKPNQISRRIDYFRYTACAAALRNEKKTGTVFWTAPVSFPLLRRVIVRPVR
jgi:hypothetical protein